MLMTPGSSGKLKRRYIRYRPVSSSDLHQLTVAQNRPAALSVVVVMS